MDANTQMREAYSAMQALIGACFNESTTVVQDSEQFVSIHHTPTLIQYSTNNRLNNLLLRLATYHHLVPPLGSFVMQDIVDQGKDVTNTDNFHNSVFLGIVLFKVKNVFDTRRFTLACIDYFITPTMIRSHNIQELFHYAYNVMKNPRLLIALFPERRVDPLYNYYPKLLQLLNVRHRPPLRTLHIQTNALQ